MSGLTQEQLQEWRRVAEAGWIGYHDRVMLVSTALPALLAEVERLHRDARQAKVLLSWVMSDGAWTREEEERCARILGVPGVLEIIQMARDAEAEGRELVKLQEASE